MRIPAAKHYCNGSEIKTEDVSKADRANNNDVPDTHYNPNNLYIEEPALEKEEKCNPTDHSVVIIEDAIVNDAFCNAKY